MTGYDGIRQNFLMALNDPAVRAIASTSTARRRGRRLLRPGGHDLRGPRRQADLVDPVENAYSAAYALASAADRAAHVPRTGGTGSVGVIYIHVSYEGFLERPASR
jgi:hypothetical protein